MADREFDEEVFRRLGQLDVEAMGIRADIDGLSQQLERIERMGRSLAEAMLVAEPGRASDVPKRFRGGDLATIAGTTSDGLAMGQAPAGHEPAPTGRARRVAHSEMVDWCLAILAENGGQMHVSDIREALHNGADRGWMVPGQGHDSNVSVHLARADEFTRGATRGMWRLTDRSAS